ncbi:DUF2057 domain-containing protein [Aeromonas schubertii]|uniref:DUF2057 domain-containing protein n=1 Tax=Aeromonas schubertii TaxID=652 RepID=A0ABS7VH85_9GAMM|nr:DUF2057 domain-containing protein [Aeromonas schubertii]MBZ6068346.1 DUF2057 domain-containing protein [Aeromonas schubertii]
MKLTVLLPTVAALAWGNLAVAAAQLDVQAPYVVELIDGQSVSAKLLEHGKSNQLQDGRHQLVVSFEGNYSNRTETRFITAEPLVLNFESKDGQHIVLDYKKPRNEGEARQFVKLQDVQLKDKVTGQRIESERFVMPKQEGFQLTRDYQQELIAMGKAFNQPKTVAVSTAAVMAASSEPMQAAPTKAMANPEALTQLQSWYNKADAETRKAFQIWVIQQQ